MAGFLLFSAFTGLVLRHASAAGILLFSLSSNTIEDDGRVLVVLCLSWPCAASHSSSADVTAVAPYSHSHSILLIINIASDPSGTTRS
jgi:hypothetical protein